MAIDPTPFPDLFPSPENRFSLRERSSGERPRERLRRLGPEALSEAELLALLLGTGRRGRSAHELAAVHLAAEGGLSGLARREAVYLARLDGLGEAKAATLCAALEIGRRLARAELSDRPTLASPERVAAWLRSRAGDWPQERVGALLLDARNRLLYDREIVRGSLESASVVPRDVLRRCLLDDAAAFVLYHNHPSGDPTPSRDDVDFTRALAAATRQVGIRFLDHVVVGREGCVSLAQRGLLGV